jgi:hypothetical protein
VSSIWKLFISISYINKNYAYIQDISQYETDLVTKCYYPKHKLVWEVLHAGPKSKIEIQWLALKETCLEDKDGTLDIMVSSLKFVTFSYTYIIIAVVFVVVLLLLV